MSWWSRHRAHYPWRRTRDPYRILVSEFMLHRTQARQVVPVYAEFVRRYPSLGAFGGGDRRAARRILGRLGLNWRVDGMLKALTRLWREYGSVPLDYDALVAVPGIGPYIAGATLAFARNRPIALVDSNTVRVVGRAFGLDLAGEARRQRQTIDLLNLAVHPTRPREYHFALIDLAHAVCRPHRPSCGSCPLRDTPCHFARATVSTRGGEATAGRGARR